MSFMTCPGSSLPIPNGDKSDYKFEIDGAAYGLTVNNDNKLCGSPNKATATSGAKIRIDISHVNCEKPESVDIPITIHPRTLTVTPRADQILYKGEAPKYDTSGEAKGETAAFSGQLAIDSPTNLIIPGDLKLIDNDKFLASNYKLELTPDIPMYLYRQATGRGPCRTWWRQEGGMVCRSRYLLRSSRFYHQAERSGRDGYTN